MKQRASRKGKLSKLRPPAEQPQDEFVLTPETAEVIRDEIMQTTVDEFNKELNSLPPAIKKIAYKFNDIFASFFEGYREGIEAELKLALKTVSVNTEALKDTPKDPLEDLVSALKANTEVLKLSKSQVEMVANKTLEEKQYKKPEGSFGKKAKDLAIESVFSAVGLGPFIQRKLEESSKKEEYIKNETKLRAAADPDFEVMTKVNPEGAKALIAKQYKTTEKKKEELQGLERQKESLISQGYKDEEINTLINYEEMKKSIVEEIVKANPRLKKELVGDGEPVEPVAPEEQQKKLPDTYDQEEQEQQKLPEPTPAEEQPLLEEPEFEKNIPALPFAKTEEEIHEESVVRDKEFKEVEKQSGLLAEIRDLLKISANKKPEEAAAPAEGSGMSLNPLDLLGGRSTPGNTKPKAPGKAGGVRGMLSKGAGLLRSKGALIGGAALAVGVGGYTAYKGLGEAESQGKEELAAIDAAEKSGELTKEAADAKRQEVEAKTTENKGGAVGKGTGMAAGAIGGAKAGAMLGTFFGPAGTVVGGLAGGALGAVAGSSVGQNIGGAIGKGVAGVKSMLGFGKSEVSAQDTQTRLTEITQTQERIVEQFEKGAPKKNPDGSPSPLKLEFDKLDAEKSKLISAPEVTKADIAKSKPSNMSTSQSTLSSLSETPATGGDMSKNIIVQAPPAQVIQAPAAPQVVSPAPFNSRIRNPEVSLTDYLRTRYS